MPVNTTEKQHAILFSNHLFLEQDEAAGTYKTPYAGPTPTNAREKLRTTPKPVEADSTLPGPLIISGVVVPEGEDPAWYNPWGDGFNSAGVDRYGFNRQSRDHKGYDRSGYNEEGFDRRGISWRKVPRQLYDLEGFDPSGMYFSP